MSRKRKKNDKITQLQLIVLIIGIGCFIHAFITPVFFVNWIISFARWFSEAFGQWFSSVMIN